LELRVLGPVELVAGESVVPVAQPQQCAVLATLVVEAGRLVPVEALVDRVWGPDPPPHARRTLHTYITRVRRLLEQASDAGEEAARLVHRTGGYLLEIDPDRVDLHRFRRLLEQAHHGCGDEQRVKLLREALGLWRGQPLTGLPGQWAARMREGWQQQHRDAVLAWARAELHLGNPAAVIPVLTELVGEHPLVEPLTAALMRALHAAGHSAEALECYTSTRQLLAEELGVDPGAELQALHQAILRGESDHAGPTPTSAPAPAPAAPVVPAQLPADVYGFAGRGDHLARLDVLLASATGEQPTAVVISAVSGTAGVGKTALAVHWAHRVRARFPDGQLYVNLRGFHPSGQVMEPAAAVRGFIDALGAPAERVPADPDAQAALYRSLLAGKQVLVVLDNARDADQARPLLPGSPTALVVVTSRNQLTSLVAADGAHPLTLDLLTHDEARDLLQRRLGAGRVAAEPDAAEHVITACARLPLALAVAAARAAQTGFPLAVLAAELADARGRLGVLDAGDAATRVRAVFSWSYTTLTPPAARLFRLLGLHPGPDISVAAAASLAELPRPEASRLLAELARASLTTEHAPGRYGLHDLLTSYAADLTHTTDSDHTRRAATGRLLDHYLHTAHTADRLMHPARDQITIPLAPPAPGTTPEQPTDHRGAMAWLDAEHPALLAAVWLAAETGCDTHTWQLTWALQTFLDRRGRWQDLSGAWQAAVAAADRLTHPTAAAYGHRQLAWAEIRLGRYGEAHTYLRRALELYTRTGDRAGQAHAHHALTHLWERQNRPDRALGHAQQALTLFEATGHRRGQGHALNAVGWCHARLGDHAKALACCRQALTLCQQAGDRGGQAATWDTLGYSHHHLGQHTQAADCYQHALTLLRDLGDRYHEATALTRLGDTHRAAGDPAAAQAAWTHAVDILTDLDHHDADAVRAKLRDLHRPPASGGS